MFLFCYAIDMGEDGNLVCAKINITIFLKVVTPK